MLCKVRPSGTASDSRLTHAAVARKIPFDDPQVLTWARIGYVAAQAIILGVYYYVSSIIKKKNDQTVLKYGACPHAVRHVCPTHPCIVDAPSPMSGETNGKLVVTTVRDYDLTEISKAVRVLSFTVAGV